MFNINKFTPVNLNNGPCSVTLTLNSMIFRRGLLEVLKRPNFIKISINEEEKEFIIMAADSLDEYAIDMTKSTIRGRINNRDFVKQLKRIAGYKEDETIRIPGKYLPNYSLILFDLTEAIWTFLE